MYGAGLSLCSAMQLPRHCAAHGRPIAVVLCGLRMPDRGGAVRPTHVPRQPHDVGGRERGSAVVAPFFLNTP
ncbi:hypothetical protein Y032_0001g107 [Ancylostoma ceylanicum]|uniref:Uncharacterized protein n=1 Tax=Ancylostoma ceylanicum TaxID=53326 RepID=A0A016W2I9_9BILA|nr:hypothetical protein Y032_0001g107 [Ancylostoma ceylanicum]